MKPDDCGANNDDEVVAKVSEPAAAAAPNNDATHTDMCIKVMKAALLTMTAQTACVAVRKVTMVARPVWAPGL